MLSYFFLVIFLKKDLKYSFRSCSGQFPNIYCFVQTLTHIHLFLHQEKLDIGTRKEVDGMGAPEIKYGDSICFIQHVDTGLWLTYQSADAKSVRMGSLQRKVRLDRNAFHSLT